MTHRIRSLIPRFLVLGVWLLLPGSVSAGELSYGQGLLWQVQAPNGRTSHVLGTFHTSDPRVLALPAPVAEALDQAETLAVEIVLTLQEQQAMALAAMLSDGRSLEQILGPELFARSAIAAQSYGLGAAQLRLFKPWGLLSLFAMPPEEIQRQQSGARALDFHLQDLAKSQGKQVVALETVAEQIDLFDSLSDEEQVMLLRSTLDEQDENPTLFNDLVADYLARDLTAIQGMMTELSKDVDPEFQARFVERLIDQRNRTMVDRAEPLLRRGKALIAVGALHLPGPQGILSLLAERGYEVSRVY